MWYAFGLGAALAAPLPSGERVLSAPEGATGAEGVREGAEQARRALCAARRNDRPSDRPTKRARRTDSFLAAVKAATYL